VALTAGQKATVDFTAAIAPTSLTITTSAIPPGNKSCTYEQNLTAINGTPPYTWSVIAGSLPTGLYIINRPWDNISFIYGNDPTPGYYAVTLQVTDSSSPVQSATKSFQTNIYGYTPITVSAELPNRIVVDVPYSMKPLLATGGVPPYTWSIVGLPDGLTLNSSTGVISGVPTTEGNNSFRIDAVDSVGLIGSTWAGINTFRHIAITTTNLPEGVVWGEYVNRAEQGDPIYLQAEGGSVCDSEWCTPRNIWSITGGALPAGMTFDPESRVVGGVPTMAGTFDITFQVTDPVSGSQGSRTLRLVIKPVDILDRGLAAGTLHKAYSDTLTAAGTPPFSWSAGNLPPGITLNPASGVLGGSPTATGNFQVSVQVTDATQATTTRQLALSVSDLDVQWERSVPCDGSSGKRVLMDNAGNVYALGTGYNAATSNSDVILTGYGAAGDQAWRATIDNGEDEAMDLVMDGGNNLYILSNYNTTGMSGHQINKITPDGGILWTRSPDTGSRASALAVDSFGNTYVSAESEIRVYKYDPSGALIWEATYDSDAEPQSSALAVDSSGNVYISAYWYTYTDKGFASVIVKFSADGALLWSKNQSDKNEVIFGTTVDSNSNIYVASRIYDSNDNDVKLVKYAASGDIVWTRTFDRIGRSDRPEQIVLDGRGNLYVVGRSYYRTYDNSDFLILKYDTDGNHLWSSTYGALGTDEEWAFGIAVDRNDNLAVTGIDWNLTTGISQMTTVKYYRIDLAITTSTLPWGTIGVPYSHPLVGKQGISPHTWSAANLPAGLSIDATSGLISGTPTTAENKTVTIQLTDARGNTVAKSLTLDIYAPLAIGSAGCPDGTVGGSFSCTLTGTGGKPPYTWELASGNLPAGCSLNGSSGVISGTPTAPGTATFDLKATDTLAVIATKTLSLSVHEPVIISPANASALTGTSQTFTWNNVGAIMHQVWVGSTSGAFDIAQTPQTADTSATISGLPANGGIFHVRLWSKFGSTWSYNDYTYTAVNPATMLTPANNTTLTGISQTFTWTNAGAANYQIWAGSTPGGYEYASPGILTATTATLSGLPANGSTVYIRLWSLFGSTWSYRDYTYTAVNPAAMLTPANHAMLSGTTQTFTWTNAGAGKYQILIGTTPGASNIGASAQITAISATMTGLPSNGSTLYVRLLSQFGSTWSYNDYSYTAVNPATMITPAVNATLSGTTQTFSWNNVGADMYVVWIGTSTGQSNLGISPQTTATTATIAGLTTYDCTIYVRLLSRFGTLWYSNDYTYTLKHPAVINDFNNDSMPDLLWQNVTTGDVSFWYLNGITRTGVDAMNPVNPGGANWIVAGKGDFNRDGLNDIVWRDATTGNVAVWYMNGSTKIGGDMLNPANPGGTEWIPVAVGDFNSDGKPDVVWQDATTLNGVVWYMDGVNRIGSAMLNPVNPGDINWKLVAAGDFNHDGKPDIIWQDAISGDVAIWYMDGVNKIGGDMLNPVNAGDITWEIATVGDYNLDGQLDLVWQNAVSGNVAFWYLSGVNKIGSNSLFMLCTYPDNCGDMKLTK
jgi:hypothetical protein